MHSPDFFFSRAFSFHGFQVGKWRIRGGLCRGLLGLVLATSFALPAAAAKLTVVATTTDLASIAQEVGGALVAVSSIAAGNQDPHFVDAKPSYLVKLQRADLFVEVGMELELGWAPNLLLNSRNAKIQPGAVGFVDASTGVAKLQVPTAADRTMGDIHPYGNPHYWLDPANGILIARNIATGLKRVDPAHAAEYDANTVAFGARLDAAMARWLQQMAPLKGQPVVAYHNSWPYFERRFGFKVTSFVEPKPGIPPSGKYIAELAASMKQDGIKLILNAPYYSVKTAELVAKESGAAIVSLSTSVDGLPDTDDYIKLFDFNIAELIRAARQVGMIAAN